MKSVNSFSLIENIYDKFTNIIYLYFYSMYTSIIHPNKFALHKNKYSSLFFTINILILSILSFSLEKSALTSIIDLFTKHETSSTNDLYNFIILFAGNILGIIIFSIILKILYKKFNKTDIPLLSIFHNAEFASFASFIGIFIYLFCTFIFNLTDYAGPLKLFDFLQNNILHIKTKNIELREAYWITEMTTIYASELFYSYIIAICIKLTAALITFIVWIRIFFACSFLSFSKKNIFSIILTSLIMGV